MYSTQFGFRNNLSTSLASVDLINNISSAVDRNKTTLGIFLDLSKVFDGALWYSGYSFGVDQKLS